MNIYIAYEIYKDPYISIELSKYLLSLNLNFNNIIKI